MTVSGIISTVSGINQTRCGTQPKDQFQEPANMLRAEHHIPNIGLDSKKEPDSRLVALGLDIRNVFFKCRDNETYEIYKHLFGKEIGVLNASRHLRRERAVRVSSSPDSLTQELTQLLKIYNVAPTNAAKPIATTTLKSGIVGYFMEYVEGRQIREHLDHTPTHLTLLRKLVAVVNDLHASGVGHGDLNPDNVIVTSHQEIKLVDPLVPYEHADDQLLIEMDNSVLDRVLEAINNLAKKPPAPPTQQIKFQAKPDTGAAADYLSRVR
jgi:hypothetical protein